MSASLSRYELAGKSGTSEEGDRTGDDGELEGDQDPVLLGGAAATRDDVRDELPFSLEVVDGRASSRRPSRIGTVALAVQFYSMRSSSAAILGRYFRSGLISLLVAFVLL